MSKYIKLEDVMTIITKMDINLETPSDRILQICLRDRINSLPSIDFEEMIKQEMSRIDNLLESPEWSCY